MLKFKYGAQTKLLLAEAVTYFLVSFCICGDAYPSGRAADTAGASSSSTTVNKYDHNTVWYYFLSSESEFSLSFSL